jgi:hypothetical protein
LKVLITMGLTVGAVAAAWLIMHAISENELRMTRVADASIAAGDFDNKRVEMDKLVEQRSRYARYKYSVLLAETMFDFLPRGDLPQIIQQLEAGAELVREELRDDEDMPIAHYAFHDIRWTNYEIRLDVYGTGVDSPSDYVDALNRIGFFEDIRYRGFMLVDRDAIPTSNIFGQIPAGEGEPFKFDLVLRLKGGHIFDPEDGSRFDIELESDEGN